MPCNMTGRGLSFDMSLQALNIPTPIFDGERGGVVVVVKLEEGYFNVASFSR